MKWSSSGLSLVVSFLPFPRNNIRAFEAMLIEEMALSDARSGRHLQVPAFGRLAARSQSHQDHL